jgi:hypothetical protein
LCCSAVGVLVHFRKQTKCETQWADDFHDLASQEMELHQKRSEFKSEFAVQRINNKLSQAVEGMMNPEK